MDPVPTNIDGRYQRLCDRLFVQNVFAMKLGLERMREALDRIGRPQEAYRKVVVAGTNGKGTTGALIAATLTAAGHRVGFYTSPHLCDLAERFRIDGEVLGRAEVLELAAAAMAVFGGFGTLEPEDAAFGASVAARWGWPAAESVAPEARLTFFELTTLMALVAFERADVEVAVLEVGMGGRLDAVNVVEPECTVITPVGIDHEAWLGTTVGAIAAEKAGTMRAGVPAVIAPQAAEAREVLVRHGLAVGARVLAAELPPLSAPSWLRHGFEDNVATAWTALKQLEPALPLATFEALLADFRWPGRRDLVWLGEGELRGWWLLDAAHNPHGAASLARWLEAEPASRPGAGVIGAMRDKDLLGVANHLARRAPRWFATAPRTERAAEPADVARVFAYAGATITASASLTTALHHARREAAGRPVLVCGSIYLLGEVLRELHAPSAFFGLSREPLSRAGDVSSFAADFAKET